MKKGLNWQVSIPLLHSEHIMEGGGGSTNKIHTPKVREADVGVTIIYLVNISCTPW